QVLLDPIEPAVDRSVHARSARLAEHGVQLVDVSVRLHARVGFAHTRAVEQRRLAPVARARVQCHGLDYTGTVFADALVCFPPNRASPEAGAAASARRAPPFSREVARLVSRPWTLAALARDD